MRASSRREAVAGYPGGIIGDKRPPRLDPGAQALDFRFGERGELAVTGDAEKRE
jgi:hypothetical protein